ncbi:MAG: hypothetical protein QXW10_03585, partial [Candidatus Micrarchaeaceae archaeon]
MHAQSAVEFIVNYSWAILIIAIVLVLLYLFTAVSSTIAPSICSFESGLYCNDVILGTNTITHTTKLLLLLTNTQPYPIANASLFAQINSANTSTFSCQPAIAGPGSQFFCTVTLPVSLSLNEFLSGGLYLSANYCGLSGNYQANENCSESQKETYMGSFSAHAQPFNFSKPLTTIDIAVSNSTIIMGKNGSAFAKVMFAGMPVRNAVINFSTNTTAYKVLPQYATTNESGIAYVVISGGEPSNVLITASYSNISASTSINFIPLPPPAYLFCVAGNSDLLNVNASYYAPITSNGIGAWQPTASYPSKVFTESCSQYNGYVYCADGLNSGGLSNATYFATLSSKGLGAWHKSTSYPIKTYYQSCPIYNGRAYCIGGVTNILTDSATNGAYYSSVSSTGFNLWNATNNYLISVYGQSCVAASSHIYCMAGVLGGSNVYYASIGTNGIGAWQQTTSYPVATFQQSCVNYGNNIYCIGGSSSGTNSYYAPITSNGIGAWEATTPYPISIYGQSCSIYNSSIYCVGGFTTANLSFSKSVYYAPITSNGIGAWEATTSYPIPVYGE